MKIRKTTLADVVAVVEIYEDARRFMRENGNENQWVGRPDKSDVLRDIEDGNGYVVEAEDGEIIGAFFFRLGEDTTYKIIYDGAWKSDTPYGVIHRIAVKHHGCGIANFIYNYCFNIRQNLRIDTHKDNLPMQNSLVKNGFEYCGIIHLENGDERLAFQKVN